MQDKQKQNVWTRSYLELQSHFPLTWLRAVCSIFHLIICSIGKKNDEKHLLVQPKWSPFDFWARCLRWLSVTFSLHHVVHLIYTQQPSFTQACRSAKLCAAECGEKKKHHHTFCLNALFTSWAQITGFVSQGNTQVLVSHPTQSPCQQVSVDSWLRVVMVNWLKGVFLNFRQGKKEPLCSPPNWFVLSALWLGSARASERENLNAGLVVAIMSRLMSFEGKVLIQSQDRVFFFPLSARLEECDELCCWRWMNVREEDGVGWGGVLAEGRNYLQF